MRALRFVVTVLCALVFVPLAAGAANAVPPDNDESTGARVLVLGDHVTEDISEATTNAGDDALNANCGAPATGNSVWYQYTPAADGNFAVDLSASDFSAGVMVFQGTPTADSLVSCGPEIVGVQGQATTTYYIMAFSDTGDLSAGTLDLQLRNAPTPVVHMSLAKRGVAFHRGAAKLHGTYACKHADSFAGIDVRLTQRSGRLKIQADGGTGVQCDGARHKWSARLVSAWGTYAQGRAVARGTIFACGLVDCNSTSVKRRVHLTWASGSSRGFVGHPTTGLTVPRPVAPKQSRWPSNW